MAVRDTGAGRFTIQSVIFLLLQGHKALITRHNSGTLFKLIIITTLVKLMLVISRTV